MILFMVLMVSCSFETRTSVGQSTQQKQVEMMETAEQSVSIPTVSYFQEKKTIAKWTERWDTPNLPTYVYLVSFGKVLGYYVADGKPASTRSYLFPEERFEHGIDVGESYGSVLVQSPDIDGTYGENNSGIRFFTASGIAVEWAGEGASYLYSDAPINFGYEVPLLSK